MTFCAHSFFGFSTVLRYSIILIYIHKTWPETSILDVLHLVRYLAGPDMDIHTSLLYLLTSWILFCLVLIYLRNGFPASCCYAMPCSLIWDYTFSGLISSIFPLLYLFLLHAADRAFCTYQIKIFKLDPIPACCEWAGIGANAWLWIC